MVARQEQRVAVVGAPSNLGLRPPAPGVEPGVRWLPAAMRAAGLLDRLGARDLGDVGAPAYSPDADAATGFRNGPALAAYARALAGALEAPLDAGAFPVVLGGDCSVLLGTTLALRRRGRYGLAFLDAYDDFSYPRDGAAAGGLTAAGLDLALATGHGPAALAAVDGFDAYVREEDVVHLGLARAADVAARREVAAFDRSRVLTIARRAIGRGAARAAGRALARLEGGATRGFWIHLDADVLDRRVMPAVDSPTAGGLTPAELETVLTALLQSPRAVGLQLTILDPARDADGRATQLLADVVGRAFAASGRARPPLAPRSRPVPDAPAPPPPAAMLDALSAPGPAPHLARELAQFGRFVGSWDLDVVYYADDGSVRRRVAGEWHFGWALEGRAVVDVWTVPPRAERDAAGTGAGAADAAPGEYGATLRFYDARLGAWRSTWHGPVHGIVWPFVAREVGDEMVLERTDEAGALVRWIFSNIEADRFRWRAVESADGGATWRVRQTMAAARRAGAGVERRP